MWNTLRSQPVQLNLSLCFRFLSLKYMQEEGNSQNVLGTQMGCRSHAIYKSLNSEGKKQTIVCLTTGCLQVWKLESMLSQGVANNSWEWMILKLALLRSQSAFGWRKWEFVLGWGSSEGFLFYLSEQELLIAKKPQVTKVGQTGTNIIRKKRDLNFQYFCSKCSEFLSLTD
jgi:hypothetical protein